MQIIDCWEVLEYNGDNDHYHKCFIASEVEAEIYKGVHGSYDIVQQRQLVIFETADEAIAGDRAKLIESAKAKLTRAEREALGLK